MVIRASKFKTKKGVYVVINVWYIGLDKEEIDFHLVMDEPTVTDIVSIKYDKFLDEIDKGKIKLC